MNNNDEKQQFPLEKPDDLCPNCGSTERIIRPYFNELEDTGQAPKGSLKLGAILQIVVPQALNRLSLVPEVPVLCITYDICAQCFTMFATTVFTMTQKVQIQPMPGMPSPRPKKFQ